MSGNITLLSGVRSLLGCVQEKLNIVGSVVTLSTEIGNCILGAEFIRNNAENTISLVETNRLNLLGKIIKPDCEILSKHRNTQCKKNAEYVYV